MGRLLTALRVLSGMMNLMDLGWSGFYEPVDYLPDTLSLIVSDSSVDASMQSAM
jgi:hypothetical protein